MKEKYMLFRKANLNDIEELIKLRIEFLCEINKPENVPEALEENLRNYFEENIKKDNFVAWLAVDNDRIISISAICFYTVPPTLKNITGRTAYIMNVYTKTEYRKKGIAAKLFSRIIEEAKEHGCRKVHLNATEEGSILYEKFNFKYNDKEMEYYI
jgi:GNAT superfamily N-acetyltransferase